MTYIKESIQVSSLHVCVCTRMTLEGKIYVIERVLTSQFAKLTLKQIIMKINSVSKQNTYGITCNISSVFPLFPLPSHCASLDSTLMT